MPIRSRKRRNSRPRPFDKLRITLAAGVAAVCVVAPPPRPADAQQTVICANCSTIAEQLLEYAKQVQQYLTQIQQLQTEINTYLNLVQNTLSLPGTVYQDATADINRITSIASGASLLSGNVGSFLGNLGSTSGYPIAVAVNFQQQIIAEQNAISQGITALGNTLALQPAQLQNYSATLAALQTQALGATGWQQVHQTVAGLVAATGQATHMMQSQLTTAMQAVLTYDTSRADRQALGDALWMQFSTYTPMPLNGQGFTFGGVQ
jgi:P-type conjugative transfer protein TrbJ